VEARLAGIAAIVAAERPHVLCLQEVTPNIEALLRASPFWADFDASPAPGGAPYYSLLLLRHLNPGAQRVAFQRGSFQNSGQGRDLTRGGLALGGGLRLVAATAHLESYLGPDATSSRERVEQMRESLRALDADASSGSFGGIGNVLFAGDTNWDDAEDGDLGTLLPPGWLDSWRALHPGQAGYTYDATANGMLMGSLRKRLDRVLVRLRDYEPAEARMVGTTPLPGVSYDKQFRNGGSKRLPVLPSDHFGLVFTMRRRKKAAQQ
jgi:tyrosyl-DNA phosphodiesterase 2